MKSTRILVSVTAALLLATASSANAFDLGAFGGLNFGNYSVSGAPLGFTTKAAPAFGAFVDFPLLPLLSIETGATYLTRKTEEAPTTSGSVTAPDGTALGATADLSQHVLQVPVMLRVSIPIVSFGAGVYYAAGLGDISYSGANGATTTASLSSAGFSSGDFGLIGSGRVSVPILPLIHLLADVRYSQGLTNLATTSGVTAHSHDLQLLAGVSFSL